jgi:hypothetical protein
MNLQKHKFDDGKRTDPKLLAEAEARGFLHGNTKYNTKVSALFFSGGEINWRTDLDPSFAKSGREYFGKCISTWGSKHEHKEAVCAMLLSELAEV